MLGGASFSIGGATVRSDFGPAGRLLACYLFAFIGRAHRRERLADLFWGGLDPDKARSAFNCAVWRIRKMLDFVENGGSRSLITVGNDVVMDPAPFIRVDTQILEEASKRAAGCRRSCSLTAEDEEQIGAAVDHYGGPFLDGYDGDWVLQERERLHCLFVASTLELMRSSARRGNYERALEYGRKILATDPLRESVQRDVMVLLVLDGQRADAIRNYQNLRSILKTDLGIDPMPDTKRLHEDILSGGIFDRLDTIACAQFGEGILLDGKYRF